MTSLNYLEHKDNKSIFLIVAGANGSGKSTIYENFLKNLPEYANIKFINPDVIAKNLVQSTKNVKSINDLSPKEQAKINFEAGKEALKIRAEKLKNHESFAIESTASSPTILKAINEAKAQGYKIVSIYVILKELDLNICRVKERVLEGGHNIPTDDIIRRYDRSYALMPKVIAQSNLSLILDNTKKHIKILKKVQDNIIVFPNNNFSEETLTILKNMIKNEIAKG